LRIRPTTWAMLWYPVVCASLAAALGAWLWSQCRGAQRPAVCRSDILPGMLMFFVAILAVGMVVLAIVWLLGRLIGRRPSVPGSPERRDRDGEALDGPGTQVGTRAQPDSGSDQARRG
jgi:hypothetical protein